MRGTDLVVAVGTYQEEIPRIGVRDEVLEELEARGIYPLEVVEKDRNGVLLAGKHGGELPEHHAEAVLRLGKGQLRDGRLPTDDELDLGDHIDDELTVHPERGPQPLPKGFDPLVGLG